MHDLGWNLLDTRCKETILRGVDQGRALGGPFHVELQPTDRCNLACIFCSTARFRSPVEMQWSRLRALVGEMAALGTRSVSISGGGEPLVYKHSHQLLETIAGHGLRVAHITTNGVGLDPATVDLLLAARCMQVRVSLNDSDPERYATTMATSASTFHRVVANIAALVQRARGRQRPMVIVQFLVNRGNYHDIEAMYDLACRLRVHGIVYNGLSYQPDEAKFTAEQAAEALELFEKVLQRDEYRRILGICSFEQWLGLDIRRIEKRVGVARALRGRAGGLLHTIRRDDFSMRDKWNHHWKMRRRNRTQWMLDHNDDPCLAPWYTMTVRADGTVPVCCVLQDRPVADTAELSLAEIWNGPGMANLRQQLQRMAFEGFNWQADPATDTDVSSKCSAVSDGVDRCHFRSFYYHQDHRFFQSLVNLVAAR